MPTHKSAKKRVKQNLKKKSSNIIALSKYRNSIRSLEKTVSEGNVEKIIISLSRLNSLASKTVKKGIIRQKKASRDISKYSKLIKGANSKKTIPIKEKSQ